VRRARQFFDPKAYPRWTEERSALRVQLVNGTGDSPAPVAAAAGSRGAGQVTMADLIAASRARRRAGLLAAWGLK
jgi:hypothetical protein